MRLGTLFIVYLGTTAAAIVSPFAMRALDTGWRQAMPVNSEEALQPAPEMHPGRPQPLQPFPVCAAAVEGAGYYDDGDFSVGSDASDCRKFIPNIKVLCSAVGEDGTLYLEGLKDGQNYLSVYTRTGELKWEIPIDNISPLALARDGTAYLSATLRSSNTLTAFNADGSVRWRVTNESDQFGGSVAPAIGPDGTVYIFSAVQPMGWPNCRHTCPAILAISPQGQERWRVQVAHPPKDLLVDADGRLLVNVPSGNLIAFDPQGHKVWSFVSEGKLEQGAVAVAGDGTVYFASRFLYALDRRGKTKWVFRPEGAYTEGEKLANEVAIAEDGTVYVSSLRNKLYAVTPTGHKKWVAGDLPTGQPGVELNSKGILRTPSAWFSVSSGLASHGWPSANRDGRNSRSQEAR